jgi:small subunit ribosomal protein S20
LSAIKRDRQNAKRRLRNRGRKAQIRGSIKEFGKAVAGGDVAATETELRKAHKILDRVANAGAIHKNTAARRKSKLARQLNALKAKSAAA